MNSIKGLLLLVGVYLAGLISGFPSPTDLHISPSKAHPVAMTGGVTTVTPNLTEFKWLSTAKESVVIVATPDGGHGSGVAFQRTDGDIVHVLTARHVIEDRQGKQYPEYSVKGRRAGIDYTVAAYLRKVSDYADLAVVTVYDPANLLRVSEFGETPPKGALVIAMGFPGPVYPAFVTIGECLGWVVFDAVYLYHSASIWYGNSGGPVFDRNGLIVGINVRIAFMNDGPDSSQCGAVPLEDIFRFLGV